MSQPASGTLGMYQSYFGLSGPPFSIVPDHRVVYMSDSHREAVAHLLHSLKTSGGFVQLTGEVGTGKTTVSRYLLQHLPDNVDTALLLNPRISEHELLESICDELKIRYPETATQRLLTRLLNLKLLRSHIEGKHTVLIIDEAQNLSREVLEQIRLLTNLETSTDKLLQIILIGQPELVHLLDRHDLRQLSQRIVGRFTLKPLNLRETREYIRYRLQQVGCERALFTGPACRRIHGLSRGIPRLINVLCDSVLMGAYSENRDRVSRRIVNRAAKEVLPASSRRGGLGRVLRSALVPLVLLAIGGGLLVADGRIDTARWLAALRGETPAMPAMAAATPAPVVESAAPMSEPESAQEPAPVALAKPEASTAAQTVVQIAVEPKTAGQRTGQSDSNGSTDSPFDLIYRLGVPLKNN